MRHTISSLADYARVLEDAREDAGLTKVAVGEALGTTGQRVGAYERGEYPPNLLTAIRHLAAIGCRLEVVSMIQEAPADRLSATENAEQASGVDRSRGGDSNGSTGHTEALALLRYALHLRQHGERAPGGGETWADWDRQAETLLRAVDQPAGVVLVDDGTWEWRWTPTADGGSYSGPHGPDICPAIGCQHEGGAA